jgi:hypothetical protein
MIPAREKDFAASASIITGKTANCRLASFLIQSKGAMTARLVGLYRAANKPSLSFKGCSMTAMKFLRQALVVLFQSKNF